MTAPDPRLDEIEARLANCRPCKSDCCGSTECQTERDAIYLLAELRKAREALARGEALHQPVTVYEYDDTNGVFKLGADGEQIEMKTLCSACTGDSVLELIGDCEYDELDYHDETHWPCPTVEAVRAAVAAANGDGQ